MMKKLSVTLCFIAVIGIISCSDITRTPGRIYMPDMAYSRAFETYSDRDSAVFTNKPANPDDKVFYNNRPVPGTIMRGEDVSFTVPKDKAGDSINYVASKQVQNPLTTISGADMKEAERLYLINCAICHGPKLNGNGPLYKDGNGPYPAKPATLVGDAKYEAMPIGQMYYSVTYGKNLMGSYASQLDHHQRWMVVSYIKAKQLANAPAAPAGGGTKTDSTATVKK